MSKEKKGKETRELQKHEKSDVRIRKKDAVSEEANGDAERSTQKWRKQYRRRWKRVYMKLLYFVKQEYWGRDALLVRQKGNRKHNH